jgi:hypothetical protein
MKVREEKNCKKSPFAFMVETPVSCFSGSHFSLRVSSTLPGPPVSDVSGEQVVAGELSVGKGD